MDIQCLQWSFGAAPPGGGGMSAFGTVDAPPYGPCSQLWPLTIPAGWYFGLTDIFFGSKFTDGPAPVGTAGDYGGRASYAIINSVISVPDNVGKISYRVPFVCPPGFVLNGLFINNDSEQQNMMVSICGLLIHCADPAITTGPNAYKHYYEAFSFLFTLRP